MMKKVALLIVVISLVLSLFSTGAFAVATQVSLPATDVNVALNKTVVSTPYSGEGTSTAYDRNNAVDGKTSTFFHADGYSGNSATGNWIYVDLGSTYTIKQIIVRGRPSGYTDVTSYRNNIEVQISSSSSFSTYKVIKKIQATGTDTEITTAVNAIWPANGAMTIALDNLPGRYVKILKTDWTQGFSVGELEVYAARNLLEVSRNATTYTSTLNQAAQSGMYAVDGNSATTICALKPANNTIDPNSYPYIAIDLAQQYSIDLVRYYSGNATQSALYVCGTNDSTFAASMTVSASVYDSAAKTLTLTRKNSATAGDITVLPSVNVLGKITNALNTWLECPVTSLATYRYIILVYQDPGKYAQINEVQLCMVAPSACYLNDFSEDGFSLAFNTIMNTDTLTTDNITVVDKYGNRQGISLDTSAMDSNKIVKIGGNFVYDMTYTVSMSNVTSIKGIQLVNGTITFTIPKELVIDTINIVDNATGVGNTLLAIGGTETAFGMNAGVTNNSTKTDKNVTVIIALFNENNTMVNAASKSVFIPAGKSVSATCGIHVPTGVTVKDVKAFIWDGLEKMTPLSGCAEIY